MAYFILISTGPGGFRTTAWAHLISVADPRLFIPDPKAAKREKNKLVVLPFLLLCLEPISKIRGQKGTRSQIRNTSSKFEPYGTDLIDNHGLDNGLGFSAHVLQHHDPADGQVLHRLVLSYTAQHSTYIFYYYYKTMTDSEEKEKQPFRKVILKK
jgi:hypothetical protein